MQLPRRREQQRRINWKYWCCSKPIGDLRNGQLESFMAAMVTPCRFTRYGCDEALRYTNKHGHGEASAHAPFDYPFGAAVATRACNSMPMSRTRTHGDLIHIFLHISLRISYSHFSPFIIYKLICCLHISIGISYSYFPH
ncbi:hypothetical protein PVAP13_9KG186255 [Panicum virgatum]|uniref:Uncharacterized protein n=1 Tax=Panicum virgatum TaxID=38727 RepID=A0A8T0NEJ9_PANVG|nr:hypothetical protein PVAP13_9KG186255 [Panicum virgatum]